MRRIEGCWSLCVLIAVLASFAPSGIAASKKKKDAAADKKIIELTWPEPPLTARIKFVDILTGELDFGRKTNWREALRGFLTGAKPSFARMYQPRDLVVSDDAQRVYASDFGKKNWLNESSARRVWRFVRLAT